MKSKLNRSATDSDGTVWFIQSDGTRQRASIRDCVTCGERFADYPSSASLHCGQECYRKTCRRCGEEFKPKTNRTVYCSYRCLRGERACEECGKVFLPTKKSQGRFCSTACAYEFDCPTGSVRDFSNGYMMVKVPPGTPGTMKYGRRSGNWMLQHRYVMQQVLGRPLEAHENVHHKNGDRADNTPENLELWKRSQPAGVRASDYHCPGCRCHEL